jgi:outer membrane protein
MNFSIKMILSSLVLFGFIQYASGQSILNKNTDSLPRFTLRAAIDTALKNNYDIKLVSNDLLIARNNRNIGNAGFLPAVAANLNNNGSNQHTVRTPASGPEQELSGVRNTSLTYGVALDWTVFDGFQMFANYDRLKELQKQGEVNSKAVVLTTIADVVNAYYALVRQQQLVVARDSAMEISRLRRRIAQNKLEIGRGSKLDVLTAIVDFNTDTSLYLQDKNLLKTSMVTLNQIMAKDLNFEFKVDQNMNIQNNLVLQDLAEKTQVLNPDLQNAFINKKIAELNLKQVKGQRYPVIGINSGYQISKSASPTGFNQKQRANGITYGLTASVNIFNGFLQRQNERNAKVSINSSELDLDRTRQTINAQLISTYQNYLTNLDLLEVESGNVEVADQNLDITLEKYRLGSISPLELREAQRSSIDAITRKLNAEYQAKVTEISLKEISGTLNVQ